MAYLVRKTNSKGQVIYYVAWREGGRGSRPRYQRIGPRKKEADAAKALIETRLLSGKTGAGVVPQQMLIKDFAREWLRSRTVRPKTMDRDARLLAVHFLPEFGSRLVSSLTSLEIAAHVAELSRKVSPWSGSRLLAVLRVMLGDAKGAYAPENVAEGVKAPTLPHTEMRLATVEQVCELLELLPSPWRVFVATWPLAGLRFGETVALEWADLDLDAAKLHVRRQQPTQTHHIDRPKYGSYGTVDLLPPLREALKDLPQRARLVFPAARGGYVNYQWFMRQVWEPALRAAGLSGLSPHDLRHWFASALIAFGEDAAYVSQQMRHKSGPRFTYGQYIHLFEERRRLDRDTVLARFAEALSRAYPVLTGTSEEASKTEGARG